MICHYCQQPTDDPRWVMGEPACRNCHVADEGDRE